MTKAFPFISCIMPTADRRRFVPQAIASFLAQEYPSKELVILDDGKESISDLIPKDSRIRFFYSNESRTLGAKRNECVRLAQADYILHWDDDDWYAKQRIGFQVSVLQNEQAEICGLDRIRCLDLSNGEQWLYKHFGSWQWLAGGSLLYSRDFWARFPFPDIQVGSDVAFLRGRKLNRVALLTDSWFYVATMHDENTSQRRPGPPYWTRLYTPIPQDMVLSGAFVY
jgi:glycosyltransferase involved in cell wall biosynthesis